MSIETLNQYEVKKVAMCIKYALESLKEGKIESCVDSLNNAFWHIGTTVEEMDNMNNDEVWG